MCKRTPLLSFVFLSVICLLLPSLGFATKSRLMGMGDLSIVIEDESNMISLWDFTGNPAGLLSDEETSAICSDFLYDDYEIQDVPFFASSEHYPFLTGSTFKAAGSLLHSITWLSFRREQDLAVGLGGSYIRRDTDARYDDHKLTYPDMHLTFCKSVRPNTCVGVDLTYLDYDFQLERNIYPDPSVDRVKVADERIDGFRTEVGLRREASSQPVVWGVSAGYERVDVSWHYVTWWYQLNPNPDFIWPVSDQSCRTAWFSCQLILNPYQRLKLGADMRLHFQNEEIQADRYQKGFSFKLRTAYEVSPAFRMAFFFWTGDSFAEYLNPVYSYFSSLRTGGSATELGLGMASKLHKRILVGVEYHFSDYPQPTFYTQPWNLETQSVNAGLEIGLVEGFSARGGYIGSSLNRGPNYVHPEQSWLNKLTFGLGFQPQNPDLVIELAYRYAPGDYRNWYGQWDVKSDTRGFSVSVKKLL
jgi:hypothetical protein